MWGDDAVSCAILSSAVMPGRSLDIHDFPWLRSTPKPWMPAKAGMTLGEA